MAEVKLKEKTELWDPPNTKHSVEPRHIKEEPEEEQLPFSPASVKTEEDDEEECDTVSIKAVNIGVQIVSVKSEEEVVPSLEPPHIKEEPEEELLQEFPFTPVSVKTEDDEDKSSMLHQRPTEENREETNGEECGAEAGCSSDPLTHLHSDSEGWGHNLFLVNPDSVSDARETPFPHRCSDCGKGFTRQEHLKNHMLIHKELSSLMTHTQTNTEEKTFRCSFCPKTFIFKRDVNTHMRIHTGEKPFTCPFCNRGFGTNVYLKQHMRTHTGEKPFSCPVCGRGFAQKCNLRAHVRIHTGEKPYICSICKRSFAQKWNLKMHSKTHSIK